MNNYCRTCKKDTVWRRSKALLNRLVVHGDFIGDYSGTDTSKAQRGQTMSRSGAPKLVPVRKCEECGRSVTE